MSDFFGDSFTEELKSFYLDSVSGEVQKFLEASDADTWEIFKAEIKPLLSGWAGDASANDFVYLSKWLTQLDQIFEEQIKSLENLKLVLKNLNEYLAKIKETLSDSEEWSKKFDLVGLDQSKKLFLHCSYNHQEFLISAPNVLEVLGKSTISPLPAQKSRILGMLAFRGDAIPIVVLDEVDKGAVETFRYFVICEIRQERFALPVSQADRLVEVTNKELQPVENSGHFQAEFVTHFTRYEDKNMYVFSLEKLVAA
ncbi:MAG: chemotaxis protein CheW [Bdellovibrionia bacterium]